MTYFMKSNKGSSILSIVIFFTFIFIIGLTLYFNYYDNIENFTGEKLAQYYLDSIIKQNEKKYLKCFPSFYTSNDNIKNTLLKYYSEGDFEDVEYTYSLKANYTSKDGPLFNTYNSYVQRNLKKYWAKKANEKFQLSDTIFEEFCSVNYTLTPLDSDLEPISETILLGKINGVWGIITID